MAQDLSAKQEAFARAVATGETLSAAYRLAGYSCPTPEQTHTRASELARNRKVADRITALQAPALRKLGITIESHLADLQALRDEARANGQFGPAVKAEESRGKVAGLYIDRQEITGANGAPILHEIRRTVIDPKGAK